MMVVMMTMNMIMMMVLMVVAGWYLTLTECLLQSCSIKRQEIGTSLVARWLRLCTPNAGAHIPSLVRELDLTCHN